MALLVNGIERVVPTDLLLRFANTAIAAGNTVTSTTETAFATKLTVPANTLAPGVRLKLLQWGLYTSNGLTPSITPRIRLGGTPILPGRLIMGLVGTAASPWRAEADFLVTDAGIVGSGVLTIDDNQIRIFGGAPVTGINLATDLDLTSSAQWSATGNSITAQGWFAEIVRPT